jgi:excisionase family DNA binding protein
MIADSSRARTWCTPAYGADHFQVDKKTFRRWIAEGKIPAYRVGRQIRIKIADLEAFAERIPAAN